MYWGEAVLGAGCQSRKGEVGLGEEVAAGPLEPGAAVMACPCDGMGPGL